MNHPSEYTPVRPLTSVLVKPSGADCNLRCAYCFYLEKSQLYPETRQHRMNDQVLEAMVRQVLEGGSDAVNFGWQGGEPTLMGLDFFRRAIAMQKKYGSPGQSVGNSLQTNGILLDEEWAAFLREYSFLIGLSLDGPEAIHDHYRRSSGGEPTWGRVTSVARMLLENKVETNALCLVNDLSARHPGEIYDFFKSIGLPWMQFIPCVETLPGDAATLAPYSVTPEAFGEFQCAVFDRWIKDFENGLPTTYVRWFESLFHTYVGVPAPECTLMDECGCYVVIEHNGDVYCCDFFVEPDCRLGSVLSGDLLEMLNSPGQRAFGRRKAALPPECLACRWLEHCRGGCLKERRAGLCEGGLNYLCRAYKVFFEHADSRFKLLAARWLKQHGPQAAQSTRGQAPGGGAGRPARNAPCSCGSGKKFKHCCGRSA